MKKVKRWSINIKEVEDQTLEDWQFNRLRIMLKEFYYDIYEATKYSELRNPEELEKFIEKWIKIHFQY